MSALRSSHSLPTRSERKLVAAVRQGDDGAFEELFSRYRNRIIAYVFGMVRDHGRAEDITQEVFISALRRLRRTERPIAFKPWIYEIAKNACIDEFRRSRRAQEVPLETGEESGEAGLSLPSAQPGPDSAFEAKQRLDDLCGAFGGLSDNQHRILVLRELEGLSYNEICEQMGVSRPVVESMLFRARRRLNTEYEDLVTGRRCEQVRGLIDSGSTQSARSLGLRARRQLARHLAHCQPCRRHARMCGTDEALFRTPSIAARVAGLLPIPWLRLRRSSSDEERAMTGVGAHSFFLARSFQSLSSLAEPLTSGGFGRAAAAAAAIAIAGVGGGYVTSQSASHGRRGHIARVPGGPASAHPSSSIPPSLASAIAARAGQSALAGDLLAVSTASGAIASSQAAAKPGGAASPRSSPDGGSGSSSNGFPLTQLGVRPGLDSLAGGGSGQSGTGGGGSGNPNGFPTVPTPPAPSLGLGSVLRGAAGDLNGAARDGTGAKFPGSSSGDGSGSSRGPRTSSD